VGDPRATGRDMTDEPFETRAARALLRDGAGAPPQHGAQDQLAVTGIECWAHHGVFDHERRDGQPFVVDLVLGLDTRPAATSGDLRDTVDYGSLVAAVKSTVQRDPVDLIETVAERISEVCLSDPRVEWARVTLHKPEAPIDATFADVTLTITRTTTGATTSTTTGTTAGTTTPNARAHD
jgi:7,8-dihydroneopterin aldolase/epimerase/oxygenase